jgi:hypothetical protein
MPPLNRQNWGEYLGLLRKDGVAKDEGVAKEVTYLPPQHQR